MNNDNNWALVDENGVAIDGGRFGTATDAHASAVPGRRFGAGKGQPVLVGRTVWTAQVGADGRVAS